MTEENDPQPTSPSPPMTPQIPIHDLTQLASWLQVRGKSLSYMALNMADLVHKHEIVTNKGQKRRTIFAPEPKLKMVQRRLRERVLMQIPVPEYVHGFVPGKSLVTNAAMHVDSGLVINIDLKDFFPNINVKRVFGFWRWLFGGNTRLAWVCSSLTTHEGHLCQGFVTSPDIANRVAWKLDKRLSALAASQKFRYTRYADDLTFSSPAYDGNCRWLIDSVREIAKEEGFIVNDRKIAIMRPHRRQVVTGLIVNRSEKRMTARIPARELKRIRAMCDKGNALLAEEKSHVEGWLSYIASVDKNKAEALQTLWDKRKAQPKWTPAEIEEHRRKRQQQKGTQGSPGPAR